MRKGTYGARTRRYRVSGDCSRSKKCDECYVACSDDDHGWKEENDLDSLLFVVPICFQMNGFLDYDNVSKRGGNLMD